MQLHSPLNGIRTRAQFWNINKESEKFKTELDALRREKEKIEHKQEKLLEAHFNDAIPLSLMKREQQSLSKQLAAIEHEISVRSTTFDDILKNLSLAFDLIEDCGRTYRKANDNIKKLMCQAIFKKIWIHEDGTVTTEFTDIYKNIVGPIERDLINQNIKSASAETDADFIDKLLKSYSNFFGQGLNNELLVEAMGIEPMSESRFRSISTSVAFPFNSRLCTPKSKLTKPVAQKTFSGYEQIRRMFTADRRLFRNRSPSRADGWDP